MPRSDNNLKSVLQDTANAIRGKTGSSAPITPRDFADEIENIPSGGGDDIGALENKTLSILSTSAVRLTASFNSCYNLQEVNLPDCLFGNTYFQENYKLVRVSAPKLLSVNGRCFLSCINLKEISLPVCSFVSGSAFNGCYKLKSINISNCSIIDQAAFSGCRELEEVNGFNVDRIYSSAFYNCYKLRSAFFPFTWILSNSAFVNCNSLSELYFLSCGSNPINLPNANVFTNTPMANSSYLGRFGSIYVPSSMVDAYKSATNWAVYSDRIIAAPSEAMNEAIWDWELNNRSDLTEIPSQKMNAKAIGVCGCASCRFSEVYLSQLKNIHYQGFNTCNSMVTASFPECEFIGEFAFNHCSNLISISFPKCSIILNSAFTGCSKLIEAVFPECIYIGSGAFSGCNSLVTLSFPKCLSVGLSAFNGCFSVEKAYFSECRFLSSYAFTNLSRLNEAIFPKLTVLPNYAFSNCKALKEINLPECVAVELAAFSYCIALSSISLPKCCFIGGSAFQDCYSLQKIILPKCGTIKGNAFNGCKSLSQIFLTSSIMTVVENSYVLSNTTFTNSAYLGHYGSIYVPSALLSDYQNDYAWSYYASRFVGLTDEEIAALNL